MLFYDTIFMCETNISFGENKQAKIQFSTIQNDAFFLAYFKQNIG